MLEKGFSILRAVIVTVGRNKMGKNLRLKSARAAKDMSQQWLADRVDVSRQTINAIEKGDYNPTIKLCIAICKVLDKTLDELFWEGETDEG
jgi:putative transcriptional regulator